MLKKIAFISVAFCWCTMLLKCHCWLKAALELTYFFHESNELGLARSSQSLSMTTTPKGCKLYLYKKLCKIIFIMN